MNDNMTHENNKGQINKYLGQYKDALLEEFTTQIGNQQSRLDTLRYLCERINLV